MTLTIKLRPALTAIAIAVAALLTTPAGAANERPRVFINDSESWSVSGGFGLDDLTTLGGLKGGAKPQTAEIIKTVRDRCPDLIVTMKQERADYIVLLQHEGGKIILRRDNKYVVFNAMGDVLGSGSTRSLGNAIKDTCKVIHEDWLQESAANTENP